MTRSPRAIDTHVGSQIRARRAMLGISQAMLGDGLGISFQQVQKYEKGTNRVGAGRLQRIAELLDVPISFFFEGDVGAPQEIAAQALGVHPDLSSSESVALARAFIAIDDAVVRLRVLKLVQSLVVHRGIEA
ncbi:helix-turn-helix domain-containing protein [Agrobacterium rubi]|uniref:helix-turn-helix domain-containing protein n=1 Tax=Agrobacterium rubi TaxID=28099 RepID=UPI0015734B33|nr:helix-turn-helix transcriptional regulator [Agrobacterium rubi]